jgi:hypothetical protein
METPRGNRLCIMGASQRSTTVEARGPHKKSKVQVPRGLTRVAVMIYSNPCYFEVTPPADISADIQNSGRLSLILASEAPIRLIVPTTSTDRSTPNAELSYALSISHDLATYHSLDSEVMGDCEAMLRYQNGSLGAGNIIVIDGPTKTSFGRQLLDRNMTDIRRDAADSLTLNNMPLDGPSTGNR